MSLCAALRCIPRCLPRLYTSLLSLLDFFAISSPALAVNV
jgi:hypothetical protein